MDWRILTCLVCFYGFLKDFRPSDPFLTQYLIEDKNMTINQIDHVIYPWYTYFYLIWLVPVLLLTDICRYKPMVIVDSIARILTWALLLWAHGLTALKISQIVFALSSAATISYYAYIYALVSVDYFQKVTGFIHWATLIGKFAGYVLGQLFVSFKVMNLYELNIITFSAMCVGLVLSLIFPKAVDSDMQHRHDQYARISTNESDDNYDNRPKTSTEKLKSGLKSIKTELKEIYSFRSVIVWSVCWATASCGYFQVSSYIQNIWRVIAPHRANWKMYNGAVNAAGTLLASFTSLLVGFLPWDWFVRGRGEGLISAVSAINCVAMILIASTREIWVAYIMYVVFRATYHAVLTMAAAQISKSLPRRRYGFVFGFNTFIALVIETILTVAVVDKNGMNANIRLQFVIYGGYFGLLAVVFLIIVVIGVNREGGCCQGNTELTAMEETATVNSGTL